MARSLATEGGQRTLDAGSWARRRLRDARLVQIHIANALMTRAPLVPGVSTLLKAAGDFDPSRRALELAAGFRRPFGSLGEARAAILHYAHEGHSNPANASLHDMLGLRPRPSDYAAMFHLQPIIGEARHILDLGGNIGNLYYCYRSRLKLPAALTWEVFDLPAMTEIGRSLAKERKADQLMFVDSLEHAQPCDILIISGSLHYFEKPLSEIIASLRAAPVHVIINRTPLTNGRPFATVQEAEGFRVACIVRNKSELIADLTGAGYWLNDEWTALENSIRLPAFPTREIPAYSGLAFTLDERPKHVPSG